LSDLPYISCRQLIDFLADYHDGSLSPGIRAEFERHLSVCPSCVAYLESYRRTVALGKAALAPSDDAASGAVPEGLVRAILAAHDGKRP